MKRQASFEIIIYIEAPLMLSIRQGRPFFWMHIPTHMLTGCQTSTFKMTNDTHEMNPITQIEKETSHKRGGQT